MLRFIHHICIETNCYQKSLRFYCEIMGFRVVKEIKDFHEREYNTWLKNKDILIELQTPKKNTEEKPCIEQSCANGVDHICFLVDDIQDEVKKIQSHAYDSFKKKESDIIYVVDGALLCKVVAPEGTVFELREQDICF